jgi:hypothetical protein
MESKYYMWHMTCCHSWLKHVTCHLAPQLKTKINKQQFVFLKSKDDVFINKSCIVLNLNIQKLLPMFYFDRLTLKTISFVSIMWLIIWNLIGFKINRFYWKWHFLVRLQTNFNRKILQQIVIIALNLRFLNIL